MNGSRRTVGSLLVALFLTLGSLGCGRGDSEGGSETTTATAPLAATENRINPMPRDRVQDGGRLTWPISTMPVTYNYLHIDGTESDHSYSKHALMPRIYLTDAGGTPL